MTDPGRTLLALDFDGTLSPIVEDPTSAYIHPGSLAALRRLGPILGGLAIVTGRPVEQVRRLGRFEEEKGLERLVVCGQYGAERWDAATGELHLPERPEPIENLARILPEWLAEHDAEGVRIEDKGLAIALHTRGVGAGVLEHLRPEVEELAMDLGLHVEPGRQVIELRPPGIDKGETLARLVASLDPETVMFAGDDLGDLPAFHEGIAMRERGLEVTLVCSASPEQDALVPLADVVLEGPEEMAVWLTGLAEAFGV